MKHLRSAVAGFVFAVGLTAAAAIGDSPPPVTAPVTDWVPNETIVVTGQSAGPAFWHVTRGNSEIWILGTISPMPQGLAWNSAHLAELIKGARAVYTAPIATAGMLGSSWFFLTHRGLLSTPDGSDLESTLPADLRRRLIAARNAIGSGGFGDDSPILAAVKLQRRYNDAHHLVGGEPWETLRRLARENHVPVRPVAEYDALDLVKEMMRLSPEGQQRCLEDAISYTEQQTAHGAALAEAWAVGNLHGIKTHFVPPMFDRCMHQAASFQHIVDRSVDDYLRVIRGSLSQPGKVVMLTDIGSLLRSTGIAEALHREGVTIEGPAE